MIEVKSSSIRGVDMGPNGLRVTFMSGKTYEYSDVSQEQMNEMLQADSVGKYFATEIRPHHTGEPVDDGPDMTEHDTGESDV